MEYPHDIQPKQQSPSTHGAAIQPPPLVAGAGADDQVVGGAITVEQQQQHQEQQPAAATGLAECDRRCPVCQRTFHKRSVKRHFEDAHGDEQLRLFDPEADLCATMRPTPDVWARCDKKARLSIVWKAFIDRRSAGVPVRAERRLQLCPGCNQPFALLRLHRKYCPALRAQTAAAVAPVAANDDPPATIASLDAQPPSSLTVVVVEETTAADAADGGADIHPAVTLAELEGMPADRAPTSLPPSPQQQQRQQDGGAGAADRSASPMRLLRADTSSVDMDAVDEASLSQQRLDVPPMSPPAAATPLPFPPAPADAAVQVLFLYS